MKIYRHEGLPKPDLAERAAAEEDIDRAAGLVEVGLPHMAI